MTTCISTPKWHVVLKYVFIITIANVNSSESIINSRLIAYIDNFGMCPPAYQYAIYTHMVGLSSMEYKWSLHIQKQFERFSSSSEFYLCFAISGCCVRYIIRDEQQDLQHRLQYQYTRVKHCSNL